jgi:hypothetical protein
MTDRIKTTTDNCSWLEGTFCRLCREVTSPVAEHGRCPTLHGGGCPFAAEKPRYDAVRGELSFHYFVNLRLGRLRDRHLVLCAFEDQGWPSRIVDPLVRDRHGPSNGYWDIVYWLNRAQSPRLIDFSCDGSGCGIRWRLAGAPTR